MVEETKLEVSILITVYNHEKYLKQCLDSILSQKTNFLFEVVIGEDCSPDKSREIVIDYAKKEVYAGRIKDSLGEFSQLPVFKQGESVIEPDSIRFNFDNQKALVWNSKTEQSGGTIISEKTKKENDSVYFISRGKYIVKWQLMAGCFAMITMFPVLILNANGFRYNISRRLQKKMEQIGVAEVEKQPALNYLFV